MHHPSKDHKGSREKHIHQFEALERSREEQTRTMHIVIVLILGPEKTVTQLHVCTSVYYIAYLKYSASSLPFLLRRDYSHPGPLSDSCFILRTIRLVELYRGQSESRDFATIYLGDVRDHWVVRVGVSQHSTNPKQY